MASHQQTRTVKKNVFEAWESLFLEQKKKNPFPTEELGEDFEKQFKNLRPGEKLARRYRELYQNYIKGRFPKWLKMIDVRRPVEAKPGEEAGKVAGGGMMPGMEMGGMAGVAAEVEWIGVIDWTESDYARLVVRFEWQQTPSTLAVVMAQEDLWVYEALLRVIESANEGATNQSNASVKRIDALEIGRDAVMAWKNSENALGLKGQSGGAGDEMGGMGGMEGGDPGAMMDGPSPMDDGYGMGDPYGGAAGGTSDEDLNQQLFNFRYIDDKRQPLPFQPQFPHATHPYAEFKMMPIRMMLVMDQRKIPKLLVECANSNMPIEVSRVRLLKTQVQASGLGSSAGGMGGGFGMGGGYGAGGMGMGGYAPPRGGPMGGGMVSGAGGPPQETGQFDVPVEIHATIYIYNPPDQEKLGTGAASTAPPAGTPAATPAAQPEG